MFGCVPCKHLKMLKNEPVLWKKSLKIGTFFCQNDSLKWVGVSRLERHTHPDQIWVPPSGSCTLRCLCCTNTVLICTLRFPYLLLFCTNNKLNSACSLKSFRGQGHQSYNRNLAKAKSVALYDKWNLLTMVLSECW